MLRVLQVPDEALSLVLIDVGLGLLVIFRNDKCC